MTILIPAWVDGTLVPAEKLAVHKRGLRHKAVSVFAMAGSKVLLQQRALSKYHTPGLWANTCCTHPHWEENPLDCANRRLEEELGITGLTLQQCDTVEYRADVGNGMTEHEIVDIFIARTTSELKIAPNPDEVMNTQWMGFRELANSVEQEPNLYTPWLRIYVQDHSDKIFGEMPK